MIRRPPRSTPLYSSAASDVYKRQVISYTSIPFVEDSYNILESSPDPGGLPYRFLIKSIISVSFFLLASIGIIRIINSLKSSD